MLLISNAPAGTRDIYTHGITPDQQSGITQSLQELCLLESADQAEGPIRLRDLALRPHFPGLSADQRPVKSLLVVPINHPDQRVGVMYLMEKEGEPEFTADDEHIAAVFAAQAGSTIVNARRCEEARKAREEMETLMDLCPIAVSIFDTRLGAVAYMNQECRRMVEMVASAEGGLDDLFISTRFTRADGRELSFEELPGTRALQSGETVIGEEVVSHFSNGSTLTQLVNCIPIFSETGDIASVLTASQDLTPLQDQELWRAEFLTMVSEELRTPLTSIKGSTAALIGAIDTAGPAEIIQWLRVIDQQADLMRGQINHLAELTQIETGTLSLAAEPTDITALIERSCDEYLRDHAAAAIRFEISDLLSLVSADEEYIVKVLHNFLRSVAIHAGDTSAITVSAERAGIYVAITISAEAATASLERPAFRNNVAENPQLFEDTTRAHTKAVELASSGDGLAMGFCRGVIEAHGGRIRTDIDESDGRLTFTFTLPTVEDKGETGTTNTRDMAEGQRLAIDEKTHVLVSIQDQRSQRIVRQALLDAGYVSVEATSLDEVGDLASSEGPELIVLDIAGREEASFRALRGGGNPLNLPAIVLCERDDEEYVVRAFEMGADGYMVKPFSPSELIARIRATFRLLNTNGDATHDRAYQSGDLRISFDGHTVSVAGEPVPMTATEYKLLAELANSEGRVLTQDMLLQRVWGPEYSGESQLLRSFIRSLRQKLGDNARKPSYIFTEHGIGYRMAKSDP